MIAVLEPRLSVAGVSMLRCLTLNRISNIVFHSSQHKFSNAEGLWTGLGAFN